jgi:Ca2+-binding EF-hand superfamily protein
MIEDADKDKDGKIDFDDFKKLMISTPATSKSNSCNESFEN